METFGRYRLGAGRNHLPIDIVFAEQGQKWCNLVVAALNDVAVVFEIFLFSELLVFSN